MRAENVLRGVTDQEKFLSPWVILIIFLVLVGVVSIIGFFVIGGVDDSIKTPGSSVFIKVSMSPSGRYSETIKVQNGETYELNYQISLDGLDGMGSLSENVFSVGSEESEEIIFVLDGLEDFVGGVYTGTIKITSEVGETLIPVILELHSSEPAIEGIANLIPSSLVESGGKAVVELKLYDLKGADSDKTFVEYGLFDFSGEKLISTEEEITIVDKISLMRFMDIPGGLNDGDYVFFVVMKNGEEVSTISSVLSVGKKDAWNFFGENQVYFFVLLVVFLLFFLIFVLYNENSQEEIIKRLRSQYREELSGQVDYLKLKQKQNESSLETSEEKETNRKHFEDLIKQAERQASQVHEVRVKEVKEISAEGKDNKEDLMKVKLGKWEKEGYSMPTSLKKMIPSVSDIKKATKS
jgi:hypothetical protein